MAQGTVFLQDEESWAGKTRQQEAGAASGTSSLGEECVGPPPPGLPPKTLPWAFPPWLQECLKLAPGPCSERVTLVTGGGWGRVWGHCHVGQTPF